jgi:hypothetical protein
MFIVMSFVFVRSHIRLDASGAQAHRDNDFLLDLRESDKKPRFPCRNTAREPGQYGILRDV